MYGRFASFYKRYLGIPPPTRFQFHDEGLASERKEKKNYFCKHPPFFIVDYILT